MGLAPRGVPGGGRELDSLPVSDPTPESSDLVKARSFVEEAAAGAHRSLAFAENALRSSRRWQELEDCLACDFPGNLHPEMKMVTKEGMDRLKMVKMAHEMKIANAKLCMDFAQKAMWYKQLVQTNGGEVSDAMRADATVDDVTEGPLAALREIEAHGAEVAAKWSKPNKRRGLRRRREELAKDAEAMLAAPTPGAEAE